MLCQFADLLASQNNLGFFGRIHYIHGIPSYFMCYGCSSLFIVVVRKPASCPRTVQSKSNSLPLERAWDFVSVEPTLILSSAQRKEISTSGRQWGPKPNDPEKNLLGIEFFHPDVNV